MTVKLLEPPGEPSDTREVTAEEENLVESLCQELDGRISRDEILRLVTRISARFQDATVTAYVPIFIRRLAREQLNARLEELSQCAATGEGDE